MFENQINWNEPITLVEGVFDAMAVKRNSIPILGKFIPTKLNEAIFKNRVKNINILLDEDAQQQAFPGAHAWWRWFSISRLRLPVIITPKYHGP